MKMFLQCIERINYPDEFEQSISKHDDDTDAEDEEDKFSYCDLSSTPLVTGRPRRRRAATFSYYPEKKKEVRLISPVKKEMSDFDEAIAARFLMNLKAASSETNQLVNNDNNYDDNNNTDNTINIKSNIVNFYRPRSNSLPDFGSKLSSLSDLPFRDDSKSGYVGIYSPEARRKRIERFNEKRKQRVWKRNIKYDVRKNFADSRVRIKGRFVRKDEEAELLRTIQ